MKPNNQKRALFDAVTNIDEDLIAEAGAPRSLSFPKNIKRIAAMAAALAILITAVAFWQTGNEPQIITVPGGIKAYACELEESEIVPLEKYALTDFADTYVYTYHCYKNRSDLGIPFVFELDSDYYGTAEIRFVLTADKGGFFTSSFHGSQPLATKISTPRLDTVYWAGLDVLYEPAQQYAPSEPFFAYVLLYADEHLVGYGVLSLISITPTQEDVLLCVRTQGFAAFCFPKIAGEYQRVSEEYVWEQIEEYKRAIDN